MGLFENILHADQTLFKNIHALETEFIPKIMPYREVQQRLIAAAIKPLFAEMPGRNILMYGTPGIGKTLACKKVLDELEEQTNDIIPLYINCWQKTTTYKIILHFCELLGLKFLQNKRTEELTEILKKGLANKSVVFVFDEIDKIEDFDFLYTISEEFDRKSIIMITNYKEWIAKLDARIKSRLLPEMTEFKPYNMQETKGILKHRVGYAFFNEVMADDAFEVIVKKTFEIKDIRFGLRMMKEAGFSAEERSSKRIEKKDAEKAILKISEVTIKSSNDLQDDENKILEIIKKNSGLKIGEIFNIYQLDEGKSAYRTFKRRIDKLEKGRFISVEKITSSSGMSSILRFKEREKGLDEF